MLSHTELKRGVMIVINNIPYQVIEAFPQRYAQGRLVVQTKLKNIITGNLLGKTIHQGETFEEAEIIKVQSKFLYSHRGKFVFSEVENPVKRFELSEEQVGSALKYLKPDIIIDAIMFQEKLINISLPIKMQLKVTEAPPGVKGERAQSGTKQVTLETGAVVNAPLFIKTGDVIEVNTETGEYSKRAE
ncbi:elongation factor P [Patescibacteria group bacterium]